MIFQSDGLSLLDGLVGLDCMLMDHSMPCQRDVEQLFSRMQADTYQMVEKDNET